MIRVRKQGKGIWFIKAAWGLARLPVLGLNRLCKYIVNPNIGFLLLLLGVAFCGGTCYRYCAIKAVRPKNVLEIFREELKSLIVVALDHPPGCSSYGWAKVVAFYITDKKYREKVRAECREKNWRDARAWSIDRMFDLERLVSP